MILVVCSSSLLSKVAPVGRSCEFLSWVALVGYPRSLLSNLALVFCSLLNPVNLNQPKSSLTARISKCIPNGTLNCLAQASTSACVILHQCDVFALLVRRLLVPKRRVTRSSSQFKFNKAPRLVAHRRYAKKQSAKHLNKQLLEKDVFVFSILMERGTSVLLVGYEAPSPTCSANFQPELDCSNNFFRNCCFLLCVLTFFNSNCSCRVFARSLKLKKHTHQN